MFYNAVIFDIDDTLYDYELCHKAALKAVAIYINDSNFEKAYSLVTKQYKLEVGNIASSHNRFIYFKWIKEYLKSDFSVEKVNELYWKHYFSEMKPFEGVVETLDFLKNNGIKLAALTDFMAEMQYKKLNKLGLLEYFDVIVTSEEVGIEKPSMKSFQYCLKMLNETPDKVIMVGDNRDRDIEGAKNMGIYTLLFRKPYLVYMGSQAAYESGTLNPTLFSHKPELDTKSGSFSSYTELLEVLTYLKSDVDIITHLSRYFGERFDLTQAAGGNISIKNRYAMLIKSSGIQLADVTNKTGYSLIKNDRTNGTQQFYHIKDAGLKKDVIEGNYKELEYYNMFNTKRASMETYMHSCLNKYVIHLHPIQVNKILVRKDAREIIEELFPGSIFIDYVKPGIELSTVIKNEVKDDTVSKVIFLANHGMIFSTDDYSEIKDRIENILLTCENYLDLDYSTYKCTNIISDMKGNNSISYFSDILSQHIFNFKSIFPDKVIYCGTKYIDMNKALTNKEHSEIDWDNISIFINYDRLYISSTSLNKCREIESVFKAHLMILENNDNISFLSKNDENNLLNMEEEKYRQKI